MSGASGFSSGSVSVQALTRAIVAHNGSSRMRGGGRKGDASVEGERKPANLRVDAPPVATAVVGSLASGPGRRWHRGNRLQVAKSHDTAAPHGAEELGRRGPGSLQPPEDAAGQETGIEAHPGRSAIGRAVETGGREAGSEPVVASERGH